MIKWSTENVYNYCYTKSNVVFPKRLFNILTSLLGVINTKPYATYEYNNV